KTNSFVSFDQLFINYDLPPLITRKYAVSELKLVGPKINVIQDSVGFNFNDLISSDSTKVKKQKDPKKELRFSVKNIQLVDGEIVYKGDKIDNPIDLNNLNLNIPIVAWDNSNSNAGIDFNVGDSGIVNIAAAVSDMDKYNVNLKTSDIDLGILTGFLKNMLNMNDLEGLLNTDLKIDGSIKDIMNMQASGIVDIENFKLTDSYDLPLLSFDTWITSVRDFDMSKYNFELAYSILDGLSSTFIRNGNDNSIKKLINPLISDTLATENENDIVTDTIQKEPPVIMWEADSVTLRNASIIFTDSSLNRPFNYTIDQFNAYIDHVSYLSEEVPVEFSARMNEKGSFEGNTTLNMTDFLDMDIKASIKNMDLLSFSPYSEYYIASPITRGIFNYEMSFNMTPTSLVNNNKIRINGLDMGKKTKDETAIKLPIRLALYVIKDKSNNINIDLPVRGNPSSPEFSVTKLILKTLVNFITKAATEPFNMLGNIVGVNPEKVKSISYNYLQDDLDENQKESLDEIAKILNSKPELIFSFVQYANMDAEIAAMGETDPSVATSNLNELIQKRNEAVYNYLIQEKEISPNSIRVSTADLRNLPEELKKPAFNVEIIYETE
ncbi:MAG: DUF748 domain-containing protein, partial [Bacteroidales bacterium]|nr:DUF748 domain-containing protein [Bacteroidales bacterium]